MMAFATHGECAEFPGITTRPAAVIREVTLEAAPSTIELEGIKFTVWAYNGQVPGPTIRLTLGETLRVHFTNHLPQATTIHWHGMRLPNAMDGVPGTTQPEIPPSGTFTYEFTPKDVGTFWYHPHVNASEQVERGLVGPLIVDEVIPPAYSQDLVWVIKDWLIDKDHIYNDFNTPHDLMHDGRWGNTLSVNGQSTPIFSVKVGERIRLRLIDAANGRIFQPEFSVLPGATVIAFDGLYADHPLSPADLVIAPGNRADLDFVVPEQYRGKKVPIFDRMSEAPLGEFQVSMETVVTPIFPTPAHSARPVWPEGLNAAPTHIFHLNAQRGGPFGIEWTINDIAMRHGHGDPAPDGHADHDQRYRLVRGKWAKLRFVNDSYRLHPMHTHGLFFRVLSRNGKPEDEGHWRDTVLLNAKEEIDVAMIPEDLGLWMMHCHILEHAESGMMTMLEVVDGP